jgi:hypothetical protein
MRADSKAVAKALKTAVFPLLRDAGFSEFTTRTAWRTGVNTIAVLDFPSLGSYLGSAVRVTSHSFGASAGLYYKAMHATPWAKEPIPGLPEEWRCQARKVLRKRLFQLWCWRPDVWYVNREGTNLDSVLADTIKAIREQALPWLHDMSDLHRALEAFESRPESSMRSGIMHEILGGSLNSFARAEVTSAIALACDQRDRARAAWERMLDNPYYKGPSEMRELAEDRIRLI